MHDVGVLLRASPLLFISKHVGYLRENRIQDLNFSFISSSKGQRAFGRVRVPNWVLFVPALLNNNALFVCSSCHGEEKFLFWIFFASHQ